jgi:Protein of unknown function (DUF3631)
VTVAVQDIRAMSDEELRAAWAADEASPAFAEARRRDQADRAAREREQIREEWKMAAHEQMLAAEAICCGNLLSREGLAHGPDDPFSLWYGREEVARKYASWELNEFWDKYPRVTIGQYITQRAAAMRAAREDTSTEEAGYVDRVDADGRADLDGHAARGLRRDSGSGAVRDTGDAGLEEAGHADASTGATTGSVRADDGRRVRVNGCRHPHRIGTPAQCGNCPAKTLAGGETVSIASEAATGARVAANVERRMAAGREAAERRLAAARSGAEMTGTVVRRPATPPARPRADAIPGDQMLDLLRQWIGTYARFPSPAALDAVTLWVAHSHMRDENGTLVFRATPRLYLLSSEPGSGKSKVLELLNMLCPATYGLTLEPTAAGLVHTIGKEHATVFIDEGDVMFGAGQRKSAVRAIINGGYERHGTMLNGKGSKATRVPVFGALALAGLDVLEKATGDTLTALLSRGVRIRMKKAGKDNAPAKVTRVTEGQGVRMNEWLTAWASQVRDELADYQPDMPEEVDGRAEQIWEPLVAIGDLAWRDTLARAERDGTEPPEDGGWAERARAACLELALAQDTAPVEDGESVLEEFADFAAGLTQAMDEEARAGDMPPDVRPDLREESMAEYPELR